MTTRRLARGGAWRHRLGGVTRHPNRTSSTGTRRGDGARRRGRAMTTGVEHPRVAKAQRRNIDCGCCWPPSNPSCAGRRTGRGRRSAAGGGGGGRRLPTGRHLSVGAHADRRVINICAGVPSNPRSSAVGRRPGPCPSAGRTGEARSQLPAIHQRRRRRSVAMSVR
jgi:hypothetical protein